MSNNFTASEQATIKAVSGVGAGLSLVGSLLIIVCILQEKVDGYKKLLVWLSIGDIMSDIVVFMGIFIDADNGCDVMGFLVTYADLVPILWTACISCSLAISIFLSYKSGKKGDAYFWWYFAFSFGVPFLLAVVGKLEDIYGPSGFGMCWISDTTHRLGFFYIPLWVVISFNAVVYFLIHREYKQVMRRHHGSLGSTSASKNHKFKYYPAVLVVTWFFGTVNRILQASGHTMLSMTILHQAFARSQGVLNALVYGWDTLVPWLKGLSSQNTETEMEKVERATPQPSGASDVPPAGFIDVDIESET
eukprot:TRINITY_DN22269_c0_g1_i1.p1 TRINITY_DN22269_c0_g1~~TRINITY_DN22269_c0_g1_i1.p1  ORF type:complete len:305 (+),score=29.70 TRINITY_DN22269_c0_g1_i1:39-953(+)